MALCDRDLAICQNGRAFELTSLGTTVKIRAVSVPPGTADPAKGPHTVRGAPIIYLWAVYTVVPGLSTPSSVLASHVRPAGCSRDWDSVCPWVCPFPYTLRGSLAREALPIGNLEYTHTVQGRVKD